MIRWAGYVMHMGEMRNEYKILVGKLEGKRPCSLGIYWRTLLKLILEKQDWRVWTGFIWHRKGTSGGLL
jgi:hypothetical protein